MSVVGQKLVAVGDVSFGDHYACASIGVNSMLRRNPNTDLFSNVCDFVSSGDLAFANLETVLSDIGLDRKCLRSMHMRGRPDDVHQLVKAGFNVVNVANNHMLQHGAAAFEETVELLRDNGLGVVGLAKENGLNCVPYATKLGETDVIFLGYGFEKDIYFKGTTLYAQGAEANILEDIRACKTKDNVVICSFHWGREFISYPNIEQVSLGRKVIDHGCDLVLGHHSHVLNGFESWNDQLIFYSLGNFVFDQLWNPPCTEGCIVKLEFSNQRFRVADLRLTHIDEDYIPVMVAGSAEVAERFDELANELKSTINDGGASYEKQFAILNRLNRHASWKYMFRNLFRYDRRILGQLVSDTLLKKLRLR